VIWTRKRGRYWSAKIDDASPCDPLIVGYESSLCDSTIQAEAKICANTILQMKGDLLSDSVSEKISDVENAIFGESSSGGGGCGDFLVDSGAESFVRIEDFGGPNSFFQIPPDFRIPLTVCGDGPAFSGQCPAVESLNLRWVLYFIILRIVMPVVRFSIITNIK
jgi:hypothetical protein